MVLMMVLPLLLMLVLPKMINDPETKKEIDNLQFPKVSPANLLDTFNNIKA